MQLYYSPGTISIAVAIAMQEAGLDYEAIKIDFSAKQQTSAGYIQINPKGRVPALVIDGGVLTETGALLEYIADIAPTANLRPSDPILLARMREVMFYLASTMHIAHAHKLRGNRWASLPSSYKDMTAKVPQAMTDCCRYITSHGLRGPFVLGDQISIADCYLYVVCTWLAGDGVTLDDFPKIKTFMTAMENRASVRALYAAEML